MHLLKPKLESNSFNDSKLFFFQIFRSLFLFEFESGFFKYVELRELKVIFTAPSTCCKFHGADFPLKVFLLFMLKVAFLPILRLTKYKLDKSSWIYLHMFCKYLVSILKRGRFQIFQSKHLLILKTFLKIMIGGNFFVCSVKKKPGSSNKFHA